MKGGIGGIWDRTEDGRRSRMGIGHGRARQREGPGHVARVPRGAERGGGVRTRDILHLDVRGRQPGDERLLKVVFGYLVRHCLRDRNLPFELIEALRGIFFVRERFWRGVLCSAAGGRLIRYRTLRRQCDVWIIRWEARCWISAEKLEAQVADDLIRGRGPKSYRSLFYINNTNGSFQDVEPRRTHQTCQDSFYHSQKDYDVCTSREIPQDTDPDPINGNYGQGCGEMRRHGDLAGLYEACRCFYAGAVSSPPSPFPFLHLFLPLLSSMFFNWLFRPQD